MGDKCGENPIKRALTSMQDTIACKGTVTKSMLRKLLQAGTISQRQFDNLQRKKSTYIQIQELMKMLSDCKTEAFKLFVDVLQTEQSNAWIVKKLKDKVTNQKKAKTRKTENHPHLKFHNPEIYDHLYRDTFPLVFGKESETLEHQNLPEERKHAHLQQFTQELSECRHLLAEKGSKYLSLREIIQKCKDDEDVQIKEQKKRYNNALLEQIERNYKLQQELFRLKVKMENQEREKLDVIENEVHRRVKMRLLNFDRPFNDEEDDNDLSIQRLPSFYQQDLEQRSLDTHGYERKHSKMSFYQHDLEQRSLDIHVYERQHSRMSNYQHDLEQRSQDIHGYERQQSKMSNYSN